MPCSLQSIAAAFAVWQAAGLRPPAGLDRSAVAFWAGQLDADDAAVVSAARAWLNTTRGKWWPTLPEFADLLPRPERKALTGSSASPTFDALSIDERARIGEIVVANKSIRWDDDQAIDAECERLARLIRSVA